VIPGFGGEFGFPGFEVGAWPGLVKEDVLISLRVFLMDLIILMMVVGTILHG
jgi:hypothetical protein